MGKVITKLGNVASKIGDVASGIFAKPKMDAAPAPAAVPDAPAQAAPATAPTAAQNDVVGEAVQRVFRKGKKSVTVSRTTGGGVGLNV